MNVHGFMVVARNSNEFTTFNTFEEAEKERSKLWKELGLHPWDVWIEEFWADEDEYSGTLFDFETASYGG